jgi:monofunctional biosynthetic peptidoglycan transglycosylase
MSVQSAKDPDAKAPVRQITLRVLRALAIAGVVLLLLPYLIAPLYRWIDPVSTLMVWRWTTGARV